MRWFGRRDADLRAEIRTHIAIETEENIERGMPPEEARRAAERTFGNVGAVREQVREGRATYWLEVLVQDARLAFRTMRRNKGFAAATLVTLALGIGANTAVFSIVYGVLLRPLPYPDPDRLVRVSEGHPGATSPLRAPMLSNLTFHAWSDSPRTIEGIAAYNGRRYTVTGFDEPSRIEGAAVSAQLFPILGARPASGRFFRPDEEAEGADLVVVLSHGFWRQQFGADPGAIGRTLVLDGRAHTVVGVAPPEFYFPDRDVRLWTPYAVRRRAGPDDRRVSVFFALGRLRPGVTPERAQSEGTAAARSVGPRPVAADLLFGKGGPVTVRVRSLADETTASVKPALVILAAGVGLVLLIACANVANLFLSRGVARERELAVRAALGAGRGRLIQQLLVESLTLSLAGGALGLILGWSLAAALPALAPQDFPRLEDVHMDGRALAFAALASIVAGVLSGLAPACRGARFDLAALHAGTRSASGLHGPRASRLRGALLVTEAALAVMLLIGAGLLVRSFARLVRVDGGYDPTNVLIARVYLPDAGAPAERSRQFLEALLARARRGPGVVAAGAGNMAPFGSSTSIAGFLLPARETGDRPTMARALEYVVTPGYAEALGLRLREGRLFTEQDPRAATQAVLVNQEFVRQYLSPGPVAGRRFEEGFGSERRLTEIVGVIGDVLKNGLDTQPQPEIYLLERPGRPILREINLVVRTSGDAMGVVPLVRGLVREIDAGAAADAVTTLATRVSASVSQPRFAAAVLAAFGGLALALAAVGLYSVLSYNVSQRRGELGVRAALGATRGDLVRLVLGQGLAHTTLGLALGLAGAAALTRLMARLLFGVTPLDVVAFGAAPALLLAVACAACLVPARRAAAADPAEALRSE